MSDPRALEARFAEYFANWDIRLPEGAVQRGEAGVIQRDGWTIRYVVDHDAEEPHLEFYATHRMTDDTRARIDGSGELQYLEALSTLYAYDPEVPGDRERVQRENRLRNARIAGELEARGLYPEGNINAYLATHDVPLPNEATTTTPEVRRFSAGATPVRAVPSAAMDDDAFRPETPEVPLHDMSTVLMASGPLKNKRGHAHLTNDRIFFSDRRFDAAAAGGAGGALAGATASAFEKLRKERPPMVDFPLTDVTRVAHVTKLTVRDILVIETAAGETRFANGFKDWSPLLRRVLTERHGRTVVDDGEDGWQVVQG